MHIEMIKKKKKKRRIKIKFTGEKTKFLPMLQMGLQLSQ